MKIFNRLFHLLLLLPFNAFSQDQDLIDSLETKLHQFEVRKLEMRTRNPEIGDTIKINILNDLANEYWNNDPDKGMQYVNQSLSLAEQIDFKKGIIRAYNSMGFIKANTGNYLEGINYTGKALKIADEFGDKQGKVIAFCNYGIIYSLNGNYPEALKNTFAALKIADEIGDKKSCVTAYCVLGNIYKDQNNSNEALKYYSISLKIAKEINYALYISANYNNIANIYSDQSDYPNALKYYTEGLKIVLKQGNKIWEAMIRNNIATIYHKQNDYNMALENYFIALKISKEANDKNGIALYLCNIGDINRSLKKYTQARKYLNEGLKLSKETENISYIQSCYQNLASLDSATGNWKGAFEDHKLFILFRDSLINEENTKKTVQAQMQYEFEKKEAITKAEHEKKQALANAEIKRQTLMRNTILGGTGIVGIFSFVLVHTFNRKNKTSFEKKVAQVETSALRSQMNPHFIFNSLNSIDDYILNNDIQNSSMYVNKFSRLMRLILESSRKEEVSLKEDLESLELYMQLENLRMQKKVECKIEVSPEINTENVLIPPMLLQPFIENSFKHAFHGIDSPKLEINISMKNDMLYCTVTDNGKGRENVQKMETETMEKRQSLGMTVTRERLDIISKIKRSKAYFEFEDLNDNQQKSAGTRVLLSVPATFTF